MRFLVIVILILTGTSKVAAQQLALNFNTPPHLNVVPVTDGILDFGLLMPNQGKETIHLKDPEVEIVRIYGHLLFTNRLILELSSSNALRQGNNNLPFTLKAAYILPYKTPNDRDQATVMNSSSTVLQFPTQGNGNSQVSFVDIYLFIYGDITVGQVPAGRYTGTINISATPYN